MRTNLIDAILNWLRQGYPHGVPHTDYHPLLALLQRTLTDDELDTVVRRLVESSDDEAVTLPQIKAEIADVTKAPPTPDEINQVSSRLAAVGWPLAGTQVPLG